MKDSPVTIGKNIRVLRHAAGIKTQAQFAQLLEVSQPQVSDWENDRYAGLEQSTLTKISNVLGCSIDVLLAGTETQAATLEELIYGVEDLARNLHDYARKIDLSPGRTDQLRARKFPRLVVIFKAAGRLALKICIPGSLKNLLSHG